MTDPQDKLTTDPPRPPGAPDVDGLVGDPVPEQDRTREAVADDARGSAQDVGTADDADPVTVEPPD